MFSIEALIRSDLSKPIEDETKDPETTPRVPDLVIADIKHVIAIVEPQTEEGKTARLELKRLIESKGMVGLCNDPTVEIDKSVHDLMLAKNIERLEALDVKLKDAQENLGESDVRDAYFAKIEFLCEICDFEKAIALLDECEGKAFVINSALARRLDLIIFRIRILLFQWPTSDPRQIIRLLEKGKKMLEGAGDWDQKTRLKVYEAIIQFSVQRDFKSAVNLFLETISTYSCYEVLQFNRFVGYTVLLAMIALDRPDLKKRVMMNSEVKQVLYSNPVLSGFIQSFYECNYATFFKHLSSVERALKLDRYFGIHYRYYVREMRIKAYEQQLRSYSSIGIAAFANAFGVSEEFIDRELSRLISTERLNCKLNRVDGVVNTTRPDTKSKAYGELVKKGDELLTRLQKLSRVINL
ncbi:hypothetical protein ACOME3_001628 [Neoechinorhynchus agilis]